MSKYSTYIISSSSSSCSGRIKFDFCSLYPQNEIGPSISSSVVLCVFVLLVLSMSFILRWTDPWTSRKNHRTCSVCSFWKPLVITIAPYNTIHKYSARQVFYYKITCTSSFDPVTPSSGGSKRV